MPNGRHHRQQHPGSQRQNQELGKYQRAIQGRTFSDESVMELAEELARTLARGIGSMKKDNSRTQVRKFYNQVRVIERQSQQLAPELLKTKLRTLQAQAAYAVARGTLTPDFKAFFDASITRMLGGDPAKLKQSLDEFVTFFESLYAYFYFHTR